MSRLIVKNLPKNITEEKLRNIFSEKGTITDVQLKYTPEGKFRQFAFIGYQNEADAEEAIKYCDKMCINTNRLCVERCAPLGDTNKPRAWSKYAAEKQEKAKTNVEVPSISKKKKEKANLLEKYKSDPMFKEFMQVHVPNEVHLLETKDDELEKEEENESEGENVTSESEEVEKDKLALKEISDAEYMKGLIKKTDNDGSPLKKVKEKQRELFTVVLRGLPFRCKKKPIKDFFRPLVPFNIRLPPKIKGVAYVAFKDENQMKKALNKNKSFIEGKRIFVATEKRSVKETNDLKRNKWKTQEDLLKTEESIAESGKIFLRNLPYTANESEIQDLFSKFGPVTEVNLPIDTTTRQVKGFGTVTFVMPEHAVRAYSALDGSIFHGRMLHLLPGKSKDNKNEDKEESTNYKEKKLAKQKQQAGKSHNWNSLFLGHDAVAEVIADTYGVAKEKVLDPFGDGSAAVRLALGETQIVATTRKYLENEGVILDAFNTESVKRSNALILVKNLPHQTSKMEIRKLFEPFGIIGRVILPPSCITAIVEFLEPSEARKAFTKLAYSKFKNALLYLEWAPENSLNSAKPKEEVTKSAETVKIEEAKPNIKEHRTEEVKEECTEEVDDDEEPEEDTTLYVKNLNFDTTDKDLHKHFESCGKIHYARVALKDKSNVGKNLSMGFGFVQFKTKAGADKALKTLQQSLLDGKSLELKRSERTLKQDVVPARKSTKRTKQTGTKILVRNVPFQAKIKELRELFGTFGEIKALRMPKKMSVEVSQHRGFAFVDFVSSSDAKAAFDALCQSTHLYGRRLVLEWASVDEDVSAIRKRTADHFTQDEKIKSKKSVLDLNI